MNDFAVIASTLLFGSLLGAAFFGGLWWTVRRLPRARHPWALYFGSLAVRLGGLLTAFYLVLVWLNWSSLIVCLIGFVLARWTVILCRGRTIAVGELESEV